MPKTEPQNCWEFWNCDPAVRKECPAYKNDSGKDCWYMAGSFNKLPTCPKIKGEYKNCWECPWFKKSNPDFDKKNN